MPAADDPPALRARTPGSWARSSAASPSPAALARLLDRDPREHDALDLAVLGLATFKAARTISRDEVTSFIREPFVEGEAHEGDEEPGRDRRPSPGGRRARHLLALRRHLGRRRPRGDADPRAALRPDPHLVARRGGRERLAPGRVLGAHEQGERARAARRRRVTTRPAPRLPCAACAACCPRRRGCARRRRPGARGDADRRPAATSRRSTRRLQVSAKLSVPRQVGVSLVTRDGRRLGWIVPPLAAHDARDRLERPHRAASGCPTGTTSCGSSTGRRVLATAPLRIDAHAARPERPARATTDRRRSPATARCSRRSARTATASATRRTSRSG